MKPEKTRSHVFTRRALFLTGGKMLLLGGLASRMYYLQVLEAEKFKVLAEDNRINFQLLSPPRGFILDRNGDYLAINVQNYRLIMIPEQARAFSSVEDVLARLSKVIELDDHNIDRIVRETKRKRGFVPINVRENLNWQDVSRIEINAPDLPGISIDVGQSRHYPYGETMAHVLGYVSSVSEKELERNDDPLLELPGFRIGKEGIEKHYDLALRGKAGTRSVEVNAIGRIIQELDRNEGQTGQDVRLTLDMRLQDYIGNRIADHKSASVVVMDAHKGDILALVSVPSFNPNAFTEGLSTEDWKTLVNNPYYPLTNKAVAGQYAPGSTFKIVVALAALEQGISPEFTTYCPGHLDVGDRRFHCWKRWGHGRMNLIDSMRESCDVWYYEVSKKIGIDNIAKMARKLGLGVEPQLDLGSTRKGLVPDKAWKREKMGKGWLLGETIIASIGQGYVLATPLQLAVMTARVVNGGKAVEPHLTKDLITDDKIGTRDGQEWEDLGIPQEHLNILMESMDEVVNHKKGTARASRIDDENFAMAGKTGTSQVRRISMAEREAGIRKGEDIAWRLRDHALFVSYAPADNPRYVCSVVVEHGGSGSKAAAPIARDCLLKVQELMEPETLAKNTEPRTLIDEEG